MVGNRQYDSATLSRVAASIATKDGVNPNYLKGPELVNLFNSIGFTDEYTFAEGRGIITPDIGEGLSRLSYTMARLEILNKAFRVSEAIQKFIDTANQPLEAVHSINKAVRGLGVTFSTDMDGVSRFTAQPIVDDFIANSAPIENSKSVIESVDSLFSPPVDDVFGLEVEENKNKEIVFTEQHKQERLNEQKAKLIEEVLGNIPTGRPVVFISYSWDSQEHQDWVTKLADDLTNKGIYVLFDLYNPDGTPIDLFMELGLERADKIIVVGSPEYKLKSLTIAGGASLEGGILRVNIYQNIGTTKIIPCVRNGSFNEALPALMVGRKGHDFTKDINYDIEFDSLVHEIWNHPKHTRPTLGVIPDFSTIKVQQKEELKYTDFRLQSDKKWLTTLLSNFSFYLMQEYTENSPVSVKVKIFESHDIWNSIITSPTFILYDPELKRLVLELYNEWHAIVKKGATYYYTTNNPNLFHFEGYCGDIFQTPECEHAFNDICKALNHLHIKLYAFSNYIKLHYEIDIDYLSRKFEQKQ